MGSSHDCELHVLPTRSHRGTVGVEMLLIASLAQKIRPDVLDPNQKVATLIGNSRVHTRAMCHRTRKSH